MRQFSHFLKKSNTEAIMSRQKIDGKCYAEMLTSGAAMLEENSEKINAMNVFPVADGDTGTNMLKTLEGGLSEISAAESKSIGNLSDAFAKGVLLAARGNSGVILSQIFAGIGECISGCDEVDSCELARAYLNGIKKSYAAVQNPTEGTILTVFRESAEYAAKRLSDSSSIEDFFKLHIEEAKRSLASTKERLPALMEADVVDSGAAGYLCIAEGMYAALLGKAAIPHHKAEERCESVDISLFTRKSTLKFGYCTEFLLRLTESKTDPDSFDISTVLDILNELGGESIVAYKQDDIVKVHVHTFNPGEILTRVQAFGEFLTVKIENMSLGHSDTEPQKKKKKKNKFSIVSVASGEGMSALFTDMGAEKIISGGQTSNPSVEEFISAFNECEAEDIIVLPNNKNVILAAERAAELYKDARIHIVRTQNLMQGYSALSVITPGINDIGAIVASAERAAESVTDCEITKAVRDVTLDGRKISSGDYMAISGGEIRAVEKSADSALLAMLESTDISDFEIMTVFVGKEVSEEERAALTEKIEEDYPELEITFYEGGQEIYDYLIALE